MSGYSLSKINPKILRRIYRACRPSLNEPNLALNLEICDYINAKEGLAPRDAAICVAKLISQRDPQTLELAIALLDNLVKNCGYPFHLQISRKEFLNELVKRFPERPPPRYTREQRLILGQIEEWYQTLCRTSKYKDDFGYIKDMHRLLTNKGYTFPELRSEDASVLNPTDNLQLLEELHREEMIVHSAKLQELVRRGKPQDLQEANRLMKIMAGFKEDQHEQHRQQVLSDAARLRRKVEILAEMLNSVEASGQSFSEDKNEALVELYASVKSSQPIITKIIEEEQAESDAGDVADLLALNDLVNAVVLKFQLLKSGNTSEAAGIKVSGGAAGQAGAATLNLIDFGDDEDETGQGDSKDKEGYTDLLSDLANLAFDPVGNNGMGAAPSASSAAANTGSASNDFFGTGGLISLDGPPAAAQAPGLALDPFSLAFPSQTPAQVQTPNSVRGSASASASTSFPDAFASAPAPTMLCVLADIKIAVAKMPNASGETYLGRITFSNAQSLPIQAVKFMVAVPKSCKLTLKPQLADSMYGYAADAITQDIQIENPMQKPLKVKWKVEYSVNGQAREETGVSHL